MHQEDRVWWFCIPVDISKPTLPWTVLDSSPNKVPNWLELDRLFQYLSQAVPAVPEVLVQANSANILIACT